MLEVSSLRLDGDGDVANAHRTGSKVGMKRTVGVVGGVGVSSSSRIGGFDGSSGVFAGVA